MKQVLVINGPNLNLLGQREVSTYGTKSLSDIELDLKTFGEKNSLNIVFFQTNIEGEIVDHIQKAKAESIDYIIINPAAYGHTSIAIRDAFLATEISFIEVHISNIYQREEFRHKTYLSDIAMGVITGFGTQVYKLALNAIIDKTVTKI